jgi:hypothetical protein
MKANELFDAIDCKKDDKARRRLNVAPNAVASVTAEELEKGVTLEALEEIGVPVFRYGTQITIHGTVPGFDCAKVAGYRAIFKNANGSIGVKYLAIDGGKKEQIAEACRAANGKWHPVVNSSGLTLQATFKAEQREEAIAFAKAAPVDLLFGSLYGLALPWGAGYAVCLYVGAIPAENVGQLIKSLTGLNPEEVAGALEEKKRKEAEKRALWQAESAIRQAEREAEAKQRIDALMANATPLTAPSERARVLVKTVHSGYVIATVEKRKGFWGVDVAGSCRGWKRCKTNAFPWPKAIAEGRIWTLAESAT